MGKHRRDEVVKVEKLLRNPRPCLAICAGKDCARAGAKHVIRAVESALAANGLAESVDLRLTKCQDFCDDGPALTVLPDGCAYVALSPAAAQQVVSEHVRDGRPVLKQLHKKSRRKLKAQLV
jgi:(2Fe-2S) ferredoxin